VGGETADRRGVASRRVERVEGIVERVEGVVERVEGALYRPTDRSIEARDSVAVSMAMAMGAGDDGLVSFDELDRVATARRGDDDATTTTAAAAAAGENEEGSFGSLVSRGSESDGVDTPTSEREEEGLVSTLRSVLTRRPSVAALKALGTLDEETTREGEEEEEDEDGVCSLSEFAMVLNAAGWVRYDPSERMIRARRARSYLSVVSRTED